MTFQTISKTARVSSSAFHYVKVSPHIFFGRHPPGNPENAESLFIMYDLKSEASSSFFCTARRWACHGTSVLPDDDRSVSSGLAWIASVFTSAADVVTCPDGTLR